MAVVPLLLMLIRVADGRFRTNAINPLAQRETRAQLIDGRVTANTLEQYVVFLVGSLTLSTLLAPKYLPTLAGACVLFMLARLAFWFGYHKDPPVSRTGHGRHRILELRGRRYRHGHGDVRMRTRLTLRPVRGFRALR